MEPQEEEVIGSLEQRVKPKEAEQQEEKGESLEEQNCITISDGEEDEDSSKIGTESINFYLAKGYDNKDVVTQLMLDNGFRTAETQQAIALKVVVGKIPPHRWEGSYV